MPSEDGRTARLSRGAVPALRGSAPFIAALLVLFFVLTVSHELTPYVLIVQLGLLAVTGLARPRWVPLAAIVIAVGYLLPNFTFVNSHYGLLSSLGNFFGNVETSGVSSGVPAPESHKIIADCTLLLSAGMWMLALVGAWLRRKSRRIVLALLVLTYSPVLVLLGGAYGNEGILRVYLFSLPWAAALAACALAPVRMPANRPGEVPPVNTYGGVAAAVGRGGVRPVLAIAVAVALFFPSFYGNDSSNEMPQDQVDTILAFQEHETPGPVICPINNFPFYDTSKYDFFPLGEVFGPGSVIGNNRVSPAVATYLARTMEHYTGGKQPAYFVITPSMAAYNQAYGLASQKSYSILVASLAKSRYWTRILNSDGMTIYKLSAAASTIAQGAYNHRPVIAVP